MANMGVIGALADQTATIVSDKLNHASLIDGCRLTRAHSLRYRHGDAAHARSCSRTLDPSIDTRLLITDGVFSMDGDLAPLPELARAARAAHAWLIVDDAHGLGVVGATGRGVCEHFGLSADDVPALVGTFGKAFGTFGAFVAGDARSHRIPDPEIPHLHLYDGVAAGGGRGDARRARGESARVVATRKGVGAGGKIPSRPRRSFPGFPARHDVGTTIVPVIVGEAQRALAISKSLEDKGFLVSAIRPPTVPAGTARLRVTLSAAHEERQVDALIAAFQETLAA